MGPISLGWPVSHRPGTTGHRIPAELDSLCAAARGRLHTPVFLQLVLRADPLPRGLILLLALPRSGAQPDGFAHRGNRIRPCRRGWHDRLAANRERHDLGAIGFVVLAPRRIRPPSVAERGALGLLSGYLVAQRPSPGAALFLAG